MSEHPRTAEPTCLQCGYDLRGHAVDVSVVCPECGRHWLRDRLEAGRTPGLRWWLTPLFLLPTFWLVLVSEPSITRSSAAFPAIEAFAGLFLLAWAALRDHDRFERLGTAFVLAEFLWLTNMLVVDLLRLV